MILFLRENAAYGLTLVVEPVYTISPSLSVLRSDSLLGYNIEKMAEIIPLTFFDAIYLVDLCEPLLKVAEARFFKLGHRNVYILCQDATNFSIPEPGWNEGTDIENSLTLVTFSYSLSMVSLA